MLNSQAMKRLIIGTALATLLASPTLAQSYSSLYGTGNIVNGPLAERSNGAFGVGVTAYNGAGVSAQTPSGSSAYAYVPRPAPRHAVMRARVSGATDLSIGSQR